MSELSNKELVNKELVNKEFINKFIIESVREDGKKFRPSDWIERLSANMGTFGKDHRLHYAKECKPGVVNGEKCLIVDNSLEISNPAAFQYIMNFAISNNLRCNRTSITIIDSAA